MKKILTLGSRSALKESALREACAEAKVDATIVVGYVDSGVPLQPVGREQIALGARNRAVAAQKRNPDGHGVGIESGVIEQGGAWADIAFVVIIHPDGHESSRWSEHFDLPTAAVQKALTIGVTNTTVGSVIAQDAGNDDVDDPHSILTERESSRADYLVEALYGVLKEAFGAKPQFENGMHRVTVGRVVRDLPIRAVSPDLSVAYFNIRGDWELTEEAGCELAKRLPAGTEALVMPEGKATALLHVMGRITRLPTVVCPKEQKVTMLGPVLKFSYESITTRRVQTLYLSADDAAKLCGKRVVIVDDVVSTGGTLQAVAGLMDAAQAETIGIAAIFTEGGEREDVISLGNLPLFKK